MSTAQSLVRVLASELVQAATQRNSFDLGKVTRGGPHTIYMVVPPENPRSHAAVIHLWVSCFLSLTRIVRRLDYLTDARFAGRFDPKPIFASRVRQETINDPAAPSRR